MLIYAIDIQNACFNRKEYSRKSTSPKVASSGLAPKSMPKYRSCDTSQGSTTPGVYCRVVNGGVVAGAGVDPAKADVFERVPVNCAKFLILQHHFHF